MQYVHVDLCRILTVENILIAFINDFCDFNTLNICPRLQQYVDDFNLTFITSTSQSSSFLQRMKNISLCIEAHADKVKFLL